MGIAPQGAGTDYRTRLRQYQRRESTIVWVGAGLAGLVVLVTSSLGSGAPKVVNAAAASLIILGGAMLALARIKFEWGATVLARAIEDGARQAADAPAIEGAAQPGDTLPDDLKKWPKVGEVCWLGGLLCVPAAALVYAAAIWLTVY